MMVADHRGKQKVLKIHRLGRISFRTVQEQSRLPEEEPGGRVLDVPVAVVAAMKEFAFMKALREVGFPCPSLSPKAGIRSS